MCTISRRLRVSKTRYSVWLFINISSPLILKKAVAMTNASIADALSPRTTRRTETVVSASAGICRESGRKATKARKPGPAERLRRMHDQLARAYGPQSWWPAQSAFEVIVGAYLTQNTAWKAVERSLANLREAGALSLEGLRAIPLDALRRLIQPSGFFMRKAPALKAFVAMLDGEFGSSLETLT